MTKEKTAARLIEERIREWLDHPHPNASVDRERAGRLLADAEDELRRLRDALEGADQLLELVVIDTDWRRKVVDDVKACLFGYVP